ncbi:MAG: LUD domain-containing protein [Bacteroidales bacterium]|nr:LUD domain-containing protein [Bacteroidales bacterium]
MNNIDILKERLENAGASVILLTENQLQSCLETHFPSILNFTDTVTCEEYRKASLEKMEKIDTALFAGRFAVAENGAIWLEDEDLPQRVLPFITQKLVLQIHVSKVVDTMQEAYQQISLQNTGFGVFISGPSKTADIEQSLVYGAHGARELTVIMLS